MSPQWFYDLHGAVRELLDQNGDVPFLAGRALAATARSFEDIAELDFCRPDEDPDEIDIAALADGRLIIGEAKCVATLGTRKEASQAIAKLLRVSDLLGADEILAGYDGARTMERKRHRPVAEGSRQDTDGDSEGCRESGY